MTQAQAACSPRASVLDEFRRAVTKVAAPYHEAPAVVLRRRIVVAITLVVGAVALGLSLRTKPGDPAFYWLTFTLAGIWFAGAFISGPLHLGGICWRGRNQRPVISGIGVGLLLAGVFVVGALIVREIGPVADLITKVLLFANKGSFLLVVLITVVNGVAEETFFRGALYTALGRHHPLVISTVLYVLATMAAGNLMLGFAGIILGGVNALQRRATGGVLAPMLTHFCWGLVMVLVLPPLFGV